MNILEARSFWVNNFFNFAVNIHDITCKTKLVLFSTNFTLALSRSVSELVEDIGSFCGGKKNNKKIDKLKNLHYIPIL